MTSTEPSTPRQALGVDVGGSGVKGALVDLDTGRLIGERFRLDTPQPATPEAVTAAVAAVVAHFGCDGPLGVTYPGVVVDGVVQTAANVDRDWIGVNAAEAYSKAMGGRQVTVLNDADAAGLAEMQFGAGRDFNRPDGGTVLLLTLGTGIGSAFFYRGRLFPNTEFGHAFLENGREGEAIAAASVRVREKLDWPDWAARLNYFLKEMEKLITPDLIILGGGIVENFELFRTHLKTVAEIRPAEMGNDAGLIGAAYYTSLGLSAQ